MNINKIIVVTASVIALTAGFSGCKSVYPVSKVNSSDLKREETIVFVRPESYWWLFGTDSMRDYVEVMYEKPSFNEAGFLQVQIGLRNRGGQHFWDVSGPNVITINAQTKFFEQPVVSSGQMSSPVYETNSQQVTLERGQVKEYKAVCPNKTAKYYQTILTDSLSN
jgi:hypothetical protein